VATKSVPRSGACSPWVSGPELMALPYVQKRVKALTEAGEVTLEQVEAMAAQAATAASDELYEWSGRIYPGECGPVTVRPVSRPTDIDTRAWGATLSTVGWVASQGFASAYGSFNPAVVAHYGSLEPPTIELPYPVLEIVQVKIDGEVIPEDEYELRDFKTLVRIRTSRDAIPVARYGWPTSQVMDLPDTEPGTFSVTYTFGNPPPAGGVIAAKKLAELLLLPQLGDTTRYPERLTGFVRQGVSVRVTDIVDLVAKGSSGVLEIEWFLNSVNPNRNSRQAAVWSPDMGRPGRRTATPSLP
jgi:hypothetical protein